MLRLPGFNARQIGSGFYEGSGDNRSTPEALGEFFARATDEDFFDIVIVRERMGADTIPIEQLEVEIAAERSR